MSDSDLEMPSRDVSLGRRNRLLFGICLLLLLAVAYLGSSVWLYVDEAKKLVAHERRTTGRLLVDQVMLIEHWEELETSEKFRKVVADLAKQLSNQEYEWKLIRPGGEAPDGPQDEYEQRLLDHFMKAKPAGPGAREFADRMRPDGNEYDYYQPIRAEQSCLMICHKPLPEGTGLGAVRFDRKPFAEGEVMAIVKITLPGESSGGR